MKKLILLVPLFFSLMCCGCSPTCSPQRLYNIGDTIEGLDDLEGYFKLTSVNIEVNDEIILTINYETNYYEKVKDGSKLFVASINGQGLVPFEETEQYFKYKLSQEEFNRFRENNGGSIKIDLKESFGEDAIYAITYPNCNIES